MPILVNCPSCNGPLRVADDLLGRKVRCPACQTVFDATENGPAAPPRDLSLDQDRVDSWKHLDLELSRDPQPAPAPAPSPRTEPQIPYQPPTRTPGLFGAVEIDPGPQEPPRRPNKEPSGPDRGPGPRREEQDDLIPCPSCRRMIHHDSTRCYSCGERISDRRPTRPARPVRLRDDDPDEQFRGYGPRRDTEPHRGTAVLLLGVFSLVCLMGFWCYGLTCILGAILGAIGWWMGQTDLSKMKANTMDRDGHGQTQAGWICSIIGTVLNALLVLTCGGIILFFVVMEANRPQNQNKGFQPPPPKAQRF